jgi:DNA-binding response OmpR family regulator
VDEMQIKPKILVVDDEPRIRDLLRVVLESRDYDVVEAEDGVSALQQESDASPNLVVLDVMMPRMDGFTCCKELRKQTDCPIMMLTAKGEVYDQVQGLEAGADDYVIKPFTPMVLVARVEALLRRMTASNDAQAQYGQIFVDTDARTVSIEKKDIALNRKEYELLSYFISNQHMSLSREQILEAVWGYDYLGTENTVDTHINRLRKKLGNCSTYIQTVRGYGYRFEVEE